MNTDTGELRTITSLREAMGGMPDKPLPEPWVEVPPHLNRSARRLMAQGKRVNLEGRSGLAAFARRRM